MSDEKIDLAWIVEQLRAYDVEEVIGDEELLALVAAVRAAREVAEQYKLGEVDHRGLKRLSAALAPFTDSAEDQS